MASRSDIQAGKAHIEVYVKNSALVKGLNFVKGQLQGLGTSIMRIGGLLSGMGASILTPLAGAVTHFAAMGSELADVSARTGQTVADLAELKFAAEQTGASLADVEAAVRMQQKNGLGNDFGKVAAEIAAIEDPAKRTQAAMEAWGKSGTKIIPMLQDLQALRQQARDLGLVPTEEAVAQADEIGDVFDQIKSVASATIFELGAALAPMLMPALETVRNIAGWFNRWARDNGEVIRTVATIGATILGVGAGLTVIGAGIFALGTGAGIAATAIVGLATVVGFLLNPVTLVVAAIGAGVFAWARFTESGRASIQAVIDFFAPLLDTARTAIGGIGDALMAGDLTLAGQIAVKALQLIFLQGLNQIADGIGGVFGTTLKAIGGKLIQGDFAGAWDTALKALAVAWDAFALGVLEVFKGVIAAVRSLWTGMVVAVTTSIAGFEAQARGAGLTGIADKLGSLRQGITGLGSMGSTAVGIGTSALDSLISAREKALAESVGDFAMDIANGSDANSQKVEELTVELAALREQAAAAREQAGLGGPSLAAPDVAGLRGATTVTFSGAALLAAGFGGGPQQEMLSLARQARADKQRELDNDRRIIGALEGRGLR